MKNYIIILPVLQASAFSLSRHHSRCIERCNSLPFKVAIQTRREACIEGCGPSVDTKITADAILTAASKDTTCVEECNAQKASRRFKSACIQRCPESSEVDSVEVVRLSEQGEQDEETNDAQDVAISTVEFDPQTYLPLKANSTDGPTTFVPSVVHRDETSSVSNEMATNQTEVAINDNASDVADTPFAATRTGLTSDNTDTSLQEHNLNETVTEMVEGQTNATDLNNADDTSTVTPSEADAIDQITDENVQDKASENQTEAVIDSSNATAVTPQPDAAEVPEHNDTSDVSYIEPSSIALDASSEIISANSTHTDSVIGPTEVPEDKSNQTLDVPSAASEAAPVSSPDLSPSQNETLANMKLSEDIVTLDPNQECIDKCNDKRTLQRKRDACLRRCSSNVSSGSATLLSKGYGGSKYEL